MYIFIDILCNILYMYILFIDLANLYVDIMYIADCIPSFNFSPLSEGSNSP